MTAWVVWVGLLGAPGEGNAALEVLEQLQQAQESRSRGARLWQAFALQEARVSASVAEAEARARRAKIESDLVRRRLTELRAQSGPLEAEAASMGALFDRVALRIEGHLDRLTPTVLPGVVPPTASPRPARPHGRFEAALDRLEAAERNLSQVEVTVIEALLDGRAAAVEVLRFGGAVAWWRSPDEERYGTVRLEDGHVVLVPVTDGSAVEAIDRAFDIAKGRSAPDLVLLPVEPLVVGAREGGAAS